MLKPKASPQALIVTKDITFRAAFARRGVRTIDAIKMTFCNLYNRGFGAVLMLALISGGLVVSLCSCDNGQPKAHPNELTQAGIEAASGKARVKD